MYSIEELVHATGVNARLIRYYRERGAMPRPIKGRGPGARYPAEALTTLLDLRRQLDRRVTVAEYAERRQARG